MDTKQQMGKQYRYAEDVNPTLWDDLDQVDPSRAALRTGCVWTGDEYRLAMVGRNYRVDPTNRVIARDGDSRVSFGEALVLLVYLAGQGPGGLAGERVAFKSLTGGAMFFTKTHALATNNIAERLNLDRASFMEMGKLIGAESDDPDGDSWLIWTLPQIPMEAFFFLGDDEFPTKINLLVDAAADRYLDLGSLFGLVNVLDYRLEKAYKSLTNG